MSFASAALLRGMAPRSIDCEILDLSQLSWHEPIERLVKAADQRGTRVIHAEGRQLVDPDIYESVHWWKESLDRKRQK